MQTVVDEIREVAAVWGSEPEDKERSFSLLAPPGRCGVIPTFPDEWMLDEGVGRRIPMFKDTQTIPPISQILTAYRASKDGPHPTAFRVEAGARVFYVMKVLRPDFVSPSIANEMLKEIRASTEAKLRELWVGSGILTGDGPDAKLVYDALAAKWGAHCLVTVLPSRVFCTCPVHLFDGHCPHRYAVEELEERCPHKGVPIPPAAVGQRALRRGEAEPEAAGSSADEQPIASLGRKRRKH